MQERSTGAGCISRLWWSDEHRRNAASPGPRPLIRNPDPSVKNRWVAGDRGCRPPHAPACGVDRALRSMAGARWFSRSGRPRPSVRSPGRRTPGDPGAGPGPRCRRRCGPRWPAHRRRRADTRSRVRRRPRRDAVHVVGIVGADADPDQPRVRPSTMQAARRRPRWRKPRPGPAGHPPGAARSPRSTATASPPHPGHPKYPRQTVQAHFGPISLRARSVSTVLAMHQDYPWSHHSFCSTGQENIDISGPPWRPSPARGGRLSVAVTALAELVGK